MRDLIMEPCLKFNPDGLSVKSFTDCNSAVCLFDVPKEMFSQYEFEAEESFKVQAELLARIMKRMKTKFVNLDFKDQRIIISDENKKEYSIAVMTDDDVRKDVPNLELNTSFKMKSVDFQDLVLDAIIISDIMRIETQEGKIKTSGGELNKFNFETECEVDGNGKSIYGLEYLQKFMSASKYFRNVLFEFSSDGPCRLTFDGELKIRFILAARVDEE